ncbi:MAG: DUF3000 family protein [Micropruina sp.]
MVGKLTEALDRYDADYTSPSGTVTAVVAGAFGAMESDPPRAEIEIRPGRRWSARRRRHPAPDELVQPLCSTAGLLPLPEGVVVMSSRRRR